MGSDFVGEEHYNPSLGLTRDVASLFDSFIEFWMQNLVGSLFEQVNSYLLLFIIHSFLNFVFYFHVGPNSNCSNSPLSLGKWKHSQAKLLLHRPSLTISQFCYHETGPQIPSGFSRAGPTGQRVDGRLHYGRVVGPKFLNLIQFTAIHSV